MYVNHCMIIKPVVKFGIKKQLDILGEYEEWLLYFAQYKTALVQLARFKASVNGDQIVTQEKGVFASK